MPIPKDKRRAYNAKAWRETSKRIRAVRARWRCECDGACGITHVEDDGVEGRCSRREGELTVAHLDHAAAGEGRDVDENLAAMCQACHLRFDMQQHLENRRRRLSMHSMAQLALSMTLPMFGGLVDDVVGRALDDVQRKKKGR